MSPQETACRKDQQPGAQPGVLDDYLNEAELAAELKISIRTLRAWRARGTGPAFVKVAKRVEYPRGGIPLYLKSLETKPSRNRRSA
jgi:hypothetical protein